MRYTKEQIAEADSMDLVSYLESRGYELMRQGNQYRLKEHDSLYVKGNQWYWHSQHKGGKTLDFLMDYEGLSFPPFVQFMHRCIIRPNSGFPQTSHRLRKFVRKTPYKHAHLLLKLRIRGLKSYTHLLSA